MDNLLIHKKQAVIHVKYFEIGIYDRIRNSEIRFNKTNIKDG